MFLVISLIVYVITLSSQSYKKKDLLYFSMVQNWDVVL